MIKLKNKKNSGLRVKKKDRFKIKKGKVPYSIAPQFIQNGYGIKETFENGLFILNDCTYNKAYQITFKENADFNAAFKILRGYDVNFSIYNIKSSYLMIEGTVDKDLKKMLDDIEKLESDMNEKLKNTGVVLKNLDTEKRFCIAHNFLTGVLGHPERALNVENYQTNIEDWMEDFLLKEADGITENKLQFENTCCCMYFLKAEENISEILKELSQIKNISIRIDFEAIKDQAVGAFFRENYMGYEKELKKIKEEDFELFEVYASDAINDDKKIFTSCGVSIMITEGEKELEYLEKLFHEISFKYNCSIEKNYGVQKELFIGFIPFSKCDFRSVRLYRSKNAENFFYPTIAGSCGMSEEVIDHNETTVIDDIASTENINTDFSAFFIN